MIQRRFIEHCRRLEAREKCIFVLLLVGVLVGFSDGQMLMDHTVK
jgi:hypothetical protein